MIKVINTNKLSGTLEDAIVGCIPESELYEEYAICCCENCKKK